MNRVEMVQMYMQNLPEEMQNEILDFVVFLMKRYGRKQDRISNIKTRREILKKAFENLASSKTFADIDDPAAWQREIRRDRSLPGREI